MNKMKDIRSSEELRATIKECKADGFVPVEKFECAVRSLKRMEKKFEQAAKLLDQETERADAMTLAANRLKADLENQKHCFGRNQTRKKHMDPFARANLVEIGTFVGVTFKYHKFLDPSWSRYLPQVPHSFYSRIVPNLDFPEDVSKEYYWTREMVPIINSKMCDKRSDATKHVQKGYLGECAIVVFGPTALSV